MMDTTEMIKIYQMFFMVESLLTAAPNNKCLDILHKNLLSIANEMHHKHHSEIESLRIDKEILKKQLDFHVKKNNYKKGWHKEMTDEDAKNLAYWERNMLVLMYADLCNTFGMQSSQKLFKSGWYRHGEWKGWERVVSLHDGKITFHVPDDFNLGHLPEIDPNWDGHTTEEKWDYVYGFLGIND